MCRRQFRNGVCNGPGTIFSELQYCHLPTHFITFLFSCYGLNIWVLVEFFCTFTLNFTKPWLATLLERVNCLWIILKVKKIFKNKKMVEYEKKTLLNLSGSKTIFINWFTWQGVLVPEKATNGFPQIPNVPLALTCLVEGCLSRRNK